jgi:hypothetical protein
MLHCHYTDRKMTRRGIMALLAGGSALAVAGCGRTGGTLRYRVTIEVDTPSGTKSGSAVLENRNTRGSGGIFRTVDMGRSDTFGEAPFVDLGNGRLLFAPLQDGVHGHQIHQLSFNIFRYGDLQPPLSRVYSRGEWPEFYSEAKRVKPLAVARRGDYPLFVTFGDLADPASVKEVDPDNLAATFGPGYSLRRLTVHVTDDAMTSEVQTTLPWLRFRPDDRLIPSKSIDSDKPLVEFLTGNCFVQKALS